MARNQLLQGREVSQSKTKLLKNLTFAHFKPLDLSRIFLNDQHFEKYNSSHAKRLIHTIIKSPKASRSHILTSLRLVKSPNPSSISLKDQHFEKFHSSIVHRLVNPRGNSSKASCSYILSFLKLVTPPNPSSKIDISRKPTPPKHKGWSIPEQTLPKPLNIPTCKVS